MQRLPTSQVAEYYDRNTRPFLRWGGSGEHLAAIHREIWGPGVVNQWQAFEYLNHYVLERLQALTSEQHTSPRALDLGCGIGGTTTWLASRCNATFVGVTLSPVQTAWATRRALQLGVSERCQFTTADMTASPLEPSFDLGYAIESLIHVADADAFFREASRLVRHGGKLVVCDDFLAPQSAPRAQPWLATFKRGWSAFGLRTWQATRAAAERHGWELEHCEDVSCQQPVAPRAVVYLGNALLRLPGLRGAYWESLRGSTALQACVRHGWVEYRTATFRHDPAFARGAL